MCEIVATLISPFNLQLTQHSLILYAPFFLPFSCHVMFHQETITREIWISSWTILMDSLELQRVTL